MPDNNQITDVFFDLDHTLWDFEKNSHETLMEICETYNLKELGVNSYTEFIKKYKVINEKLWTQYRLDKISLSEKNTISLSLARRILQETC